MGLTLANLRLEMELQEALKRNEFRVYYQPKPDLISGKIMGVEALIRWEHPKVGVVSPGEFISYAEDSGLIIPIGEWVLRQACLESTAWRKSGLPPILLSVNLSVRQLYEPNFVDNVHRILKETNFDPKFLAFEITESILMDKDLVFQTVLSLKHIGVQISLDDFGTGFSSLRYLREFPIDIIKIDQSFIRNCTSDLNDAKIVKSIIAMAHQLNLNVIAEGIEYKEQLIFLQQNLCNIGQGYLFSKPIPSEELIQRFNQIEQITLRENDGEEAKGE